MTQQAFHDQYATYLEIIEPAIVNELEKLSIYPEPLFSAIKYALTSGGKRVRPVLVLNTANLLDVPIDCVMPIALAIECIHTYSIIHDDLPAMDNDKERRGQSTCHIKFGEDIAILAGDALLTHAFSIVSDPRWNSNANVKLRIIHELSNLSGKGGMIAGQVLDVSATHTLEEREVIMINKLKTGALFRACIMLVTHLKEANSHNDTLKSIADDLGLLFQFTDDVLDNENGDIHIKSIIDQLNKNIKNTVIDSLDLNLNAMEFMIQFAEWIVNRK